jgi:hypothetical protein
MLKCALCALETVRGERKRSSESEQQCEPPPSMDVSRTKTSAAAQKLYAQLNQMVTTSGGEEAASDGEGTERGSKMNSGNGSTQPARRHRSGIWLAPGVHIGWCGWCVSAGLPAVRALTCIWL